MSNFETEKRRAAKEATAKCARDDTAATLERLWNDHVLPHWDNSIRESRTRELWWRGIPANVRPTVWTKAITNELGLTPNTFHKALERAKAIESSITVPSTHSIDLPKEYQWLQAIRRDINTTFPTLHEFQPGQPLHQPLLNVLSAYAFYRSDVGYVYGSHLPAALLVLVLRDETTAFTALANLLNRPVPLAFLTGDPAGTQRTYDLVLRLLAQKRPKLFKHLFGAVADGGLALTADEILEPMLRPLFLLGCGSPASASGTPSSSPNAPTRSVSAPSSRRNSTTANAATTRSAGISLPLALRLWDIIVFDGDSAIIRTCMGLLAARESALYGEREEVLAILGWGGELGLPLAAEGDEEEGVEKVIGIVRDVGKEDAKKARKSGGGSSGKK